MDTTSPCVRNCCLDEEDVCLGCNRSIEEIIRWGESGDEERLAILEKAKERLAERLEKYPLK